MNEEPGYESIADMLPSIIDGSTQCPLCGSFDVHNHTPLEIVCYRNGVKYGRRLGFDTSGIKFVKAPSLDDQP